jgi:hypothetical protein
MRFTKPSLTALALVAMAFLGGCIKMNVNQTISDSGKSSIEVIYDMQEFASYMEGMGEEGDETSLTDEDMQESCTEFYEQTTWENANCEVADWVFTMSGDVTLSDTAWEDTGSTYRYDLKNLYELLNAVGESQDQEFSDEALKEQKDMVELTGIELTYTLTMPGPITKADVGTIQEDDPNTVVVNLFDLADVETAYVESAKGGMNTTMLIVVGAVILVVVAGVVVMATRKKKAPGIEVNKDVKKD